MSTGHLRPPGRHRIFLGPIREDVGSDWAYRHWMTKHARVFAATPRVRGYVQNRPLARYRPLVRCVCAEVWFDDAESERRAFTSRHYTTVVAADEQSFIRREATWTSVVTGVDSTGTRATYRVLAFGRRPQEIPASMTGHADVLSLARRPPSGGPALVTGVWVSELPAAHALAERLGPHAFVTRPEAIIAPPVTPWQTAQVPA